MPNTEDVGVRSLRLQQDTLILVEVRRPVSQATMLAIKRAVSKWAGSREVLVIDSYFIKVHAVPPNTPVGEIFPG